MRLLIDHLRVHAVDGSKVVHKLALLLRHVGQDLHLLVRRKEAIYDKCQRHAPLGENGLDVLREALLNDTAELRVSPSESQELVAVGNLLSTALAIRNDA